MQQGSGMSEKNRVLGHKIYGGIMGNLEATERVHFQQ